MLAFKREISGAGKDVPNSPHFEEKKNSTGSGKGSTAPRAKVRKTLRPTSTMLKSFNLKNGANEIEFVVRSGLQGTAMVSAHIYLYEWNTKLVISDVDGTVTKSDVMGHIMPVFGRDWAHEGISELYTKIKSNGYEILYLSSRPIGHSLTTREYLFNLDQNGAKLPRGPIVMSPDLIFPSLRREVVFKRPELFKIPALRDIVNLFPENANPFVAGFGNRETDAISYRAIGVELDRIFIINTASEIHQYTNRQILTYTKLVDVHQDLFPTPSKSLTAL
jgi:phosphatidate phosphatase LPIN